MSASRETLRVLHLLAGAEVGGAETFATDLIVALAQEGVEQRVVTRPHPIILERLADAGVPVEALDFGFADLLRLAPRRIRRLAAASGADLVHAWMGRANSFVPRAMPCPVLGWFGGYYDLKRFRRADFRAGVTQDIARHIVASGGTPERTLTLHTFGTLPDEPPASRAELDTPADATVLLVLSRMHGKKGIDTMLKALVRLPGVHLWLAGDGPEKAHYEALSESLGLRQRVRFLGWRTDRAALLKAADICVLPSRYEPFGTVIAEAWAMQRPLVATRAKGAEQYVTDGRDGLLCPIDDEAALAERIARLVASPELRRSLAENGDRSYRARFHRDVVVRSYLDAYRRIAAQGRRPATEVDGETLDRHLVGELTRRLAGTVPEGDRPRVKAAVETALAFRSQLEAEGEAIAVEAAVVELSGCYSFRRGPSVRPRITVCSAEDWSTGSQHFDLAALSARYRDFARCLANPEALDAPLSTVALRDRPLAGLGVVDRALGA